MAPKDIARSYPKRGLTADVGFRSEPKFCGDGSVYFDGSSDYAETAASTDLAVGDTFTLTAWVWLNPNPGGASKYALRVGDTGAAAPNIASIGVFGGANPTFYCYNGSGSMSSSITCDSARWYHVASVIKSGAGNSQIFVDGIDVTNSHAVTFDVTSSSSKIRIGDWTSGANDWEGYIANACLFTESLTEDQVRQVMRASDYASHAAISTVEAFYPLSANFNDSTGSHNATLTGSVSFGVNRPQLPRGLDLARGAAQARVYTGRAVEFDGSADYLATETSAALGDTFTITAWIKRNSAATLDYVVNVGNPSGAGNAISISIGNTNPGLLYFFDNGTSVYTTNKVEYNTWYHVALTVAPGAGTAKVYMNGIDGTPAHSVNINITDTTFEIGRYLGGSHWFYGWISDVRVYNQTLTADQVKELYHYPEQVLPTGVSASNLIHRWALSDYNDATAGGMGGRYFQDSAGSNAMEDKASSSMAFAQPVPCPQLGLQQSASRIYWDDNTAEKLSATIPALGTDFTIAFWWFNENSPTADVFLEVNTPGTYQFYYDGTQIVYYSSTAGTFYTGVSLPVGEWSHIGLTQNGVYQNGVLYTTTFSLDWLGTAYRMFGRHSASNACAGVSSNMAFWSDALTTAEMLELYNQGPDYDPRNDTGNYASSDTLQNLWFMDDLTTVKDRKGSNDLTVIGDPIMQSFPENASGSTIVGDFSMRRKGVSVLNFFDDSGSTKAVIPAGACEFSSYPDGAAFSCFFRMQKHGTGNNNCFFTNFGTAATIYTVYPAGTLIRGDVGYGSTRITNTITAPTDSDWHHYALVTTYGSPSSTKVYLDGALVQTQTGTLSAAIPTTLPLTIGSYGASYENTGPLACMKFYKTSLSDDEVEQIYRSDLRLIKGLNNE